MKWYVLPMCWRDRLMDTSIFVICSEQLQSFTLSCMIPNLKALIIVVYSLFLCISSYKMYFGWDVAVCIANVLAWPIDGHFQLGYLFWKLAICHFGHAFDKLEVVQRCVCMSAKVGHPAIPPQGMLFRWGNQLIQF